MKAKIVAIIIGPIPKAFAKKTRKNTDEIHGVLKKLSFDSQQKLSASSRMNTRFAIIIIINNNNILTFTCLVMMNYDGL